MSEHVWYARDQDRYNAELAGLDRAGIAYEIDVEAKAEGILRLRLSVPADFGVPGGTEVELVVIFPDYYPYFRPEVYAPSLDLPRHQNLINKALCLIPRETSFWKPAETLVEYLRAQLPAVIEKGAITDENLIRQDETEQAEPQSEYYTTDPAFPLIADTSFYDGVPPAGTFQVLGRFRYGMPIRGLLSTRLAAVEYHDFEHRFLGALPKTFQEGFEVKGVGVACRIGERPPDDPKDFEAWLARKSGNERAYTGLFRGAGRVGSITVERVVAIRFPEEVAPGETGWGWLGYVKAKQDTRGQIRSIRVYVRVLRANEENFNRRVPKLKPLALKTVSIIGLGALGAPSAIEFARNGVKEIRLVDFDLVDPATTVRWPLGTAYAGLPKTSALRGFIEENYPYTNVVDIGWKVGAPVVGPQGALNKGTRREHDIINQIFEGSSLIYDASAEIGIMHFLSRLSKDQGVPYISVEATQGVYGGQVMRSIPGGAEGCWMCLMYAQSDGTIPQAPSDPDGRIQAAGCGDLSFTGASFDLQNIHGAGVRLAISTLCRGHGDAYPDFDWDVGVLSLVDEKGRPIAPAWQTFNLEPNPKCTYCGHG